MVTFTQQELQFLLNAIHEEVKRIGLPSASMGHMVATKLQELANELPPQTEDSTEPAKVEDAP